MSAQDFVGKWKLVETLNFNEYMKEVGIGWLTRQAGNMAKPELEISVQGNHWVMDSRSTFKDVHTEFDLGKEFIEETPDGRKMKVCSNFSSGTS